MTLEKIASQKPLAMTIGRDFDGALVYLID